MIRIPVTESSAVAEARRQAGECARSRGFGEADEGRVKLIVTEIATNIIKHGGGGDILVGNFEEAGKSGIEVLGLDKGPGIARLEEALADGYSSAGSAGNGLGAIRRQSEYLEVASWPGLGTAMLARIQEAQRKEPTQRPLSRWGAVRIAKPGEDVCGDAWSVAEGDGAPTFLVVDGLGHGPHAAAAANEAVVIFQRHRSHSVPTLLEYIHGGLRATRGAAVAVARVDAAAGRLTFGGIGNIAGAAISATGVKRLVSLPGTAGHNARKIQAFDHPFAYDMLIMHSDGLSTSWSLDRYPGLASMHPTLIAGVLCRDFWRQRDDVTVLVMRGGPSA
jgi:anti-sigma regulatory factor (Ser/Thr protein kinase)